MTTVVTRLLPLSRLDLEASLRARDHDPEYASAPVLDVYGRISKDPETGLTEKVDRQLEDCLRDVARRHARLGEVLRDDGVSAWSVKAKRRDWLKLVQRLEARVSAGVVTWHTDRLMRQPRDLERLIDFGDRGVLVASCHGDYNLASSDDRFTLRVLTAAAAKESDNNSRRQRRKAQAMRESGRLSGGGRAFGFPGHVLLSQEPEGFDPSTDTRTVVSPEQVEAEREGLRWAVAGHLDGVLSLHGIATEWNRRGLRTSKGNAWDARTVSPVLRSPRLAALMLVNGALRPIEGMDPVISREVYEASAALFASRRRGRPVTAEYLLSGGFLFCQKCGQPMTGKVRTGRVPADGMVRRAYACRKRGNAGGGVNIDAAAVDAAVRAWVVRELSDPKHARQVARQSAALAKVTADLDKARNTATELSRRLGEGMDLDRYDAAVVPLDARIARLQAEAVELRREGAGAEARQASADEIAAAWDAGAVEDRRARVREAAPYGFWVLPAPPARGQNRVAADRLQPRTRPTAAGSAN